ncbi:MAG TPA: ADP-glyceromanno-heptose 6-epimerase [Steroidobacteraceae bacterium]|jgi:ADP-L-glycero-D-manno-heptose 6-epimerase|nr:ADP-glyceromanno-heptose 6-epimerase [Steroidobacteraceae bacterium]
MYLVTGSAGFIGSNLVARLAARGEAVAVCDWLGQDERWRNLAHHELAALVAPEALMQWLARPPAPLQGVLHMGAISTTTERDVERLAQLNIRATLELLQWCTEHQVRFIYASSAATYGDGSAGFDDDGRCEALAMLRPLNAYGWSKHVVDRRVARLAREGSPLPPQCVGLKFFNVYGPNEYHKGSMQSVIARNFARASAGEALQLFRSYRSDYADGGQLRDFIYVRDCIDVMEWLLDQPRVSGLFNVGTGQARSWLDLAGALFAACEQPRNVQFIDMPETLQSRYQYFTEARMQRLREAGYRRPFTSLEAGVADYVSRYLCSADPYL